MKTHKNTNNYFNNNNVVYKIFCNDCSASYVGQTKRQLKTKTKEHSNNSKSTSAKPSVITEHIMKYSHSFNWNNIKILDKESNYFKKICFRNAVYQGTTKWHQLINRHGIPQQFLLLSSWYAFRDLVPHSTIYFTLFNAFKKRGTHLTHPVPYFNIHYNVYNNCLFLFLFLNSSSYFDHVSFVHDVDTVTSKLFFSLTNDIFDLKFYSVNSVTINYLGHCM